MTTSDIELLRVDEVAALLRQSRESVYRRIHSGELEAVRVGETGPLRVPVEAMLALLQPARRTKA